MPPTMRAGSFPRDEAAAKASGKLAPHSRVAGRMVHRQRAISIWKLNQGLELSMGFTGQYGSDSAIMYAVQKMPNMSRSCDQPSASRGRIDRAIQEPAVLPMPNPIKKTARIIE